MARTINDLLAALEKSDHGRCAVATEADVRATETALGFPLPPSYRTFVTEFSNGAYLYLLQEVSAVGVEHRELPVLQNPYIYKCMDMDETIPLREGGEIKRRHLVPFGRDHNGNAWCFLTESAGPDGEYPVAYLSTHTRKLYAKQNSFAAWLQIQAETQIEVIRALFDNDVIDGELGLG